MNKISIILLVILFIGCKTVKTVEQSHEKRKDSISYVERVKIDTLKIPGEKIQIELPCDQIKPQSSFQGRTKVKAQPNGNGYIITASCDSIEKIVISKDREINRLSEALKVNNTQKTVELSFLQRFWIGTGKLFCFLLLVWLIIIIAAKWKKLR
ncbi:hypothetical protein J0383_07765 [Flavobacterium endoglycinae]|uniref:Uncharacterized protein n=1 Tax=Flavobacterium endoglycinae TaxID=2816357 RepID=A0ABX7QHW9_9FLAO|nr:hypothetical protein [Flavobacterium endoglycinae]QSW90695.1 hypothetical protein J0383_07765 [Flavobacterium endoglycinae]